MDSGNFPQFRWKYVLWAALTVIALAAVACGSAASPGAPGAPPAAGQPGAPAAMPVLAAPGILAGAKEAPAIGNYWKPPTAYYGQPVYGGEFRLNYEDPLEHGNSWGAYTGATVRLRSPTMNHLVQTDPYDGSKIIPDLVGGWTHHDDSQGITLYFYNGIKWHNGAPFTCEDARFTLHTMTSGEGLTAPEMKGKLSFLDMAASKCESDGVLNLRFKRPTATALLAFTDRAALVFNKAWFQAGGEKAMTTDLAVGTGPFVWAKGQSVGNDVQRFEKNPNYFIKGMPYLDKVTIFGIVDESRQQASMLAHQTDWHWVRNFGQYAAYNEHPQVLTVIRATRGHHTMWLNKRNPPFDNVKVRQAFAMAIDRDAGVKSLQEGFGSLGFMMAPGSAWELDKTKGCAVPGWCAPADGNWTRQRAEAKKLLEQEKFDFNKEYVMTVESDAQVTARATFVQEQLRLLGVKTKFDMIETVAYRKKTTDGSWGDILTRNDTMPADDPSLGMGHYMRCASVSNNHWRPGPPCDDKMEALLDKAASTVDRAERKKVSDEIQLYAMESYWRFPLYWEQEAVAFWPEIRGYYHHPQPSGSFVRWHQLWYNPANKNDKKPTTGVPVKGIPGGIY
ncbi:MAG TPA: ABC transporter substrate-binding protein [Dehalococcoidia bacterium]|nr:ABC transporter substrate-binding protein [Dehalococcoidia bacterium]